MVGFVLILDAVLEDKVLALVFVALHWLTVMVQNIFMRSYVAEFLFHGIANKLSTFLLIYYLTFYSCGLNLAVTFAAATVLSALAVVLFVFVEVPALRTGRINEQHIHEGVFLRRLNVQ